MWYLLEFSLPNGGTTYFWHTEITNNCKVYAVRDVVEKPKNNLVNAMEVIKAGEINDAMFKQIAK